MSAGVTGRMNSAKFLDHNLFRSRYRYLGTRCFTDEYFTRSESGQYRHTISESFSLFANNDFGFCRNGIGVGRRNKNGIGFAIERWNLAVRAGAQSSPQPGIVQVVADGLG